MSGTGKGALLWQPMSKEESTDFWREQLRTGQRRRRRTSRRKRNEHESLCRSACTEEAVRCKAELLSCSFVCLSFNSKAFQTNQCCYTTGSWSAPSSCQPQLPAALAATYTFSFYVLQQHYITLRFCPKINVELAKHENWKQFFKDKCLFIYIWARVTQGNLELSD